MSVLLAVVLAACTCNPDPAIIGAFDDARERALAAPEPAGAHWLPDLVLHLGSETVAELVQTGLADAEQKFRAELPLGYGVTLTTRLKLTGLTLAASPSCADCWAATAVLAGTLGWSSPVLGKGAVPVDVAATIDVAVVTGTTPKAYTITAVPKRVLDVDLDIAGLPKSLIALADAPVRQLVTDALSDVPPFRLTEIARDQLPVRAFQVAPEGAGLRIELLSEANDPGRVPIRDPRLTVGWQLDASARSVLALARREAFSAPRQVYDLVPVPESLAIDGSRFRLGLRLWRLSAPGWWRDYTAAGTVEVAYGDIDLTTETVEEGPRSPGAGRADPLALLGEGVIVDTITDVLQRSIPASGKTTAQGHEVTVTIERIGGRAGTIEVGGTLRSN